MDRPGQLLDGERWAPASPAPRRSPSPSLRAWQIPGNRPIQIERARCCQLTAEDSHACGVMWSSAVGFDLRSVDRMFVVLAGATEGLQGVTR